MSNQLGGKAAIVGIGATEFSKDSGRSEMSLASEAVLAAIRDAGLEPSDIDGMVTYSTDIAPLLTSYCTRCHRVGRTDGNVNLEAYDRVLTYANNGTLLGSAGRQPGSSAMPPSGGSIPACDLQKLTAWVEAGAPNN